ncbi:unnamed protein product [Camellia sinensis]
MEVIDSCGGKPSINGALPPRFISEGYPTREVYFENFRYQLWRDKIIDSMCVPLTLHISQCVNSVRICKTMVRDSFHPRLITTPPVMPNSNFGTIANSPFHISAQKGSGFHNTSPNRRSLSFPGPTLDGMVLEMT